MLTIKSINFGHIFCATGARGFYGEGYPFHRLWKYAGMNWDNTGFAGKTLTLLPRRGQEFGEEGNMPLQNDGVTPKELVPRCIWTSFRHNGEMINAVSLSSFGAEFYLRTGNYHRIGNPFFISFMPLAKDASGRESELHDFCKILKSYLPFRAPVALQINCGCPNSGHDLNEFYAEICMLVEIAGALLGIPIVINCNALMPTAVLIEVSRIADALWIGNSIPFNDVATHGYIDWSRYGNTSPIRRRGFNADGGLSSPVCLPFTIRKIRELRDSGVSVPIVGGNGIRNKYDLGQLDAVGCDAVFIGSLAVVRPHRMKMIVDESIRYFSRTKWHGKK